MYRHSTVFFSFVVVARLLAGLCLARDAAPAAARTQPRTPPRAARRRRRRRAAAAGSRGVCAIVA
jgi:hypothetical protein